VVSTTTVATLHIRTANLWVDLTTYYRQGNKRLWACVKAERMHFEHLF